MPINKSVFLTFLILVLSSISSLGQTKIIDSLEVLLSKHKKENTRKVDLLNKLAYETFRIDPEKTKEYAKMSADIAEKINYQEGIAASIWAKGLSITRSDREGALELHYQALRLAEKINDKKGICTYLIEIGIIKQSQRKFDESLEIYEKAYKQVKEIGDKELEARVLINRASILRIQGDVVGAAEQLQIAMNIAQENNLELALASVYSNLGMIHQVQGNHVLAFDYRLKSLAISEKVGYYSSHIVNLVNSGDAFQRQGSHNSAIEMFTKAKQLALENKDSILLSTCYTHLGITYEKMKQYDQALSLFHQSLATGKASASIKLMTITSLGTTHLALGEYKVADRYFNEAIDLVKQQASLERRLGEVYLQKGILHFTIKQYDSAKIYIYKSLDIAEKTNFGTLKKDCYEQLSALYAKMGNINKAYESQLLFKNLSDSLLSDRDIRKIALLESTYKFKSELESIKFDKSKSELRIKNQRLMIISLVIISFLVFSLSLLSYWNGRLKKKVLHLEIDKINQELEENKKAIALAKLKLVQNSERDAKTVQMLENIGQNVQNSHDAQDDGMNNIKSLISDYKFKANHSNWEEFETLFVKVNSSFWEKLNTICPNLTPNERKLCVFLKLNMSTKDIALITFQSDEALKKSRHRLRQKLGLERGDNLSAFINNL